MVQELCSANASVGGRPVVILAHKSKQAMEEELAKHLVHKKGTTIICRSVSASDLSPASLGSRLGSAGQDCHLFSGAVAVQADMLASALQWPNTACLHALLQLPRTSVVCDDGTACRT